MTNNHKTILSVAAIMLLVLTLGFTLFPRLKTGSPVADFTSPFTVFPTGSGTVFINLSQGNPSQWTWIFDSGNPDTSWNQVPDSVFYTSPGYYDVTLIVSNAYGADTLVRENFVRVYDPDSVNTPPVAGFTASKRLFMQGSTIYFFDTSSNYPCSWQWTIENAYQAYITSALQNPYGITFLSPGLFDVSLVVSNAYGADSVYRENYIVLCDSMWPPDDLCDTISNVPDFTENIGFLTMEQTWGYFPGHNGAGIIAYADKYTDD
ncbi:MAG: PKD domain-containing protein [Bacteroidetes bacterium]|nr:PKD domain-containing protein [Bacteroidota bacterium]